MTETSRKKSSEDSGRDDVLIPPVTLDKSGKLRELRPRSKNPFSRKPSAAFLKEFGQSVKNFAQTVLKSVAKSPPVFGSESDKQSKKPHPAPEPAIRDVPVKPKPEAEPLPVAEQAEEPEIPTPPQATSEVPAESSPNSSGEETEIGTAPAETTTEPPAESNQAGTAATEKTSPAGTAKIPPPALADDKATDPPAEKKEDPPQKNRYAKKIFLVHGADDRMKKKTTPVLEKLGFGVIPFDEGINEQYTLFERSLKNPDIGFAVVLLTIEDFAYPKNEKPAQAQVRVSQNVVFQLGFLIGRLGRQRVFVLYPRKDNFELPTRYFDAYYTPLDDEGRWKRYLLDRLRTCEYPLPERVAL